MPDYQFTIFDYSRKPNYRTKILTGQRFEWLLVIGYAGLSISDHQSMWHCLCDCGNGRTYSASQLGKKDRKSCGCWQIERMSTLGLKHGQARKGHESPEYKAYARAKSRCVRPESRKRYLDRGIKFLFTSLEEFIADIGLQPTPRHQVDRINNNGNYEVGNVRWATPPQNSRNRENNRLFTRNGVSQVLADWESQTGIDRRTLYSRYQRGWCESCVVSLPPKSGTCIHNPVRLDMRNVRKGRIIT